MQNRLSTPTKLFLLLLSIGVVLLLAAYAKHNAHNPQFTVIGGKQMHLSDYRGKWIVINYWASWCKPCYKEIPELNAFYQANKAQKVVMFGVNYDRVKQAKVLALASSMGMIFPNLAGNPIKQFGVASIKGLPATYIISPEGKLVKTLFGPQTQAQLNKVIGIGDAFV